MMGAALIKCPEFCIDEKEAKRLSDSITRVNELYGGFMISEKTAAWVNLTFALGQVYGPRAMAYKLRMAAEAEEKKQKNAMQPMRVV